MPYLKVSFLLKSNKILSEILIAELYEQQFDSFEETQETLNAYICKSFFNEKNLTELLNINPLFSGLNYTIEEIPDKNWNELWEKSFEPIVVAEKCIIKAPFHQLKKSYPIELIIEPKMSFGTGHHQTTALMIEQMLGINFKNKKVLDMGCGTGVLAFLAEKLGAAQIMAIDNDEWAYYNSLDNKALNNSEKVQVELGNATYLIDKTFNTILANINRNILLLDMHLYANCLTLNDQLLISGFFKTDSPVLIEKAKEYGFCLQNASYQEEWACLLLKKE
ncbi:MAG: 50S ribosomal protein L11 methyltransferase [Flavobacteriales bacterium]|nr:50S ribosomal protein L11 methyltransferase [Flavobacteriales bacterium]